VQGSISSTEKTLVSDREAVPVSVWTNHSFAVPNGVVNERVTVNSSNTPVESGVRASSYSQ
jgi:hypothetical protein